MNISVSMLEPIFGVVQSVRETRDVHLILLQPRATTVVSGALERDIAFVAPCPIERASIVEECARPRMRAAAARKRAAAAATTTSEWPAARAAPAASLYNALTGLLLLETTPVLVPAPTPALAAFLTLVPAPACAATVVSLRDPPPEPASAGA